MNSLQVTKFLFNYLRSLLRSSIHKKLYISLDSNPSSLKVFCNILSLIKKGLHRSTINYTTHSIYCISIQSAR